MIKSLYISTLTMSSMFAFMNHPLSMGFILLIQVTLIAMITGIMAHNFWFSYILFMIMIGGMLVLFIYMTSVASNEKFLYSNKVALIIVTAILLSMMSVLIDPFKSYQLIESTDTILFSNPVMFSLSLNKYFNYPTNWIMMMMIIYLLITLIAVVKITNITYGPLRQKF